MTIRATYRNGAFFPNSPISLPEGSDVEVVLPLAPRPSDEKVIAAFEARFPGVAGSISKEDAEELERIIEEEFGIGSVNPDDWR